MRLDQLPIEIPESERTPLVNLLLNLITEQQKIIENQQQIIGEQQEKIAKLEKKVSGLDEELKAAKKVIVHSPSKKAREI